MRQRFRFSLGLALIGLIALPIAAISGAGPAGANGTKTASVSVQTQYTVDGTSGAMFVAEYDGFFKKNHLNVSITPGSTAGVALENVAASKVDCGISALDLLPQAINSGSNVIGIMGWYQKSPVAACAVAGKHTLTSPAALKGLTVALATGATFTEFMPVLLSVNNLPTSAVTAVNISPSLYASSLFEGQVDVIPCYLNESYWVTSAAAAKQGIKLSVLPFSKFGVTPSYQLTVIAKKTYASRHQAITRRFVKALVQAALYMRKHATAAAAAVVKADPLLTQSVVKQQVVATSKLGDTKQFAQHGYGWFSPTLVASTLKLFIAGGIPGSLKVKATTLYTNKYLPGK